MKHPESHLVTETNGPRPAGKPTECFYCQQAIGQEHLGTCVCRHRTVIIEAHVSLAVSVPESWSESDINSYYTGSSCGDNLLATIESAFAKDEENSRCACDSIFGQYVEEATAEQEARYICKLDIE